MPHLSPISWILIPILTWTILFMLLMASWFSSLPLSHHSSVSLNSPSFTDWKW